MRNVKMNMLKCGIMFLCLGMVLVNSNGQALSQMIPRPLTVGDSVPDIAFTAFKDGNAFQTHFSNYRGKLVILDFWATWCGPCIAALPKMHQLQQQFGDKVQIIAVTMEPATKVKTYFDKHNAENDIKGLIVITDDSVFSKYFIYHTIPHEVWIDDQGEVKAITTDNYVTDSNICRILRSEIVDWPIKDEGEIYSNFDSKSSPLFTLSSKIPGSRTVNYYSGITNYIPARSSRGRSVKRDSAQCILRYNQYNASVLSLYAIAYGKPFLATDGDVKRTILNIKDKGDFIYDKHASGYYDQWIKKNLYNYEAIHPIDASTVGLKKRLKDDLDFFLRVTSKIEKRIMPVLVLKRIDTTKQTDDKLLTRQEFLRTVDGDYIYTQQNELLFFGIVYTLNTDSWVKELPLVVDETDYNKGISMKLSIGKNPNDISSWREALRLYGFDLIPEEREIEILILSATNDQ